VSARPLLFLLAAGCLLEITPQRVCAQITPLLEESLPPPGDPTVEIDEDLLGLKSPSSPATTDRGKRASAAAAYALGLRLENEGQLKQALQRFRQAAEDDPLYVPTLARVGLVLLKLKQPREALTWTESAFKRHPGSGELMALLAVIHGELKNPHEAEKWAQRSITANPELVANYAILVQQAASRGETSRVRELFEMSKKIHSEHASFYARLASIWIQLLPADGKTLPSQAAREVAPFLEKAAALEPDNLLLTLSLGQAAFMGGDYAVAKTYFEKVEKKRPALPVLLQRLAECCLRLGLYAEAIVRLEKLWELYPTRHSILPVLGELHGKLNQWPQAVEKYQQAVLFSPRDPKIDFALAEAQMKANDLQASRATLQQGIKNYPRMSAFPYLMAIVLFLNDEYPASHEAYVKAETLSLANHDGLLNRDFYFRKAMAAEKAGQWDAMESDLRRCLELNPNDHESMNFLGYAWAERNQRLGEAEKLIRRAVEMQPTNGAYLDSLGWVYFQQGQYQKARAYLARAVEKMPDDPVVLEHLGDAWSKLGKKAKALECWTKALEKSENPEVLRQKIKDAG
jgi:tetratricopeptide (TPR) repeat protein